MASYTQNYQLHQWEGSDAFLRTDFNEDFKKIDNGIAQVVGTVQALDKSKCRIITGSYAGNAKGGVAKSQEINLGAAPQAVFICNSYMHSDYTAMATAARGLDDDILVITDTGFRVLTLYDSSSITNSNLNAFDQIYIYVAII